MQFLHHDFYSNFTASIKSGDMNLTNDILANEISDFIVFDTDKIIEALNKSDIKINDTATDEDVVDTVIKNISDNKKLVKALSFIIADGNELINSGDNNNKQKQLKVIDNISQGLSKIAKDISKDPKDFKDSAMKQVVSKASQRKEYNRTIWNKDKNKMSSGVAILVTLGLITVVIGIIYYRQKRAVSAALPNMILGGDAAGVIPPAQVPPVTPMPTVVQPIALAPEPVPTQPIK